MPACCDGLRHEALALEALFVEPLGDLGCGEAVAVCGEGGYGVFGLVGRGEPFFGVEVVFYVCELDVEGAGDAMGDALVGWEWGRERAEGRKGES